MKRVEEEKGTDLDLGEFRMAFNVTREAAVAVDEHGFADGAVLGGAAERADRSGLGRRGRGEGLGDWRRGLGRRGGKRFALGFGAASHDDELL